MVNRTLFALQLEFTRDCSVINVVLPVRAGWLSGESTSDRRRLNWAEPNAKQLGDYAPPYRKQAITIIRATFVAVGHHNLL
jgi:hypothetical protein